MYLAAALVFSYNTIQQGVFFPVQGAIFKLFWTAVGNYEKLKKTWSRIPVVERKPLLAKGFQREFHLLDQRRLQ
jgi:hypothetical protein